MYANRRTILQYIVKHAKAGTEFSFEIYLTPYNVYPSLADITLLTIPDYVWRRVATVDQRPHDATKLACLGALRPHGLNVVVVSTAPRLEKLMSLFIL